MRGVWVGLDRSARPDGREMRLDAMRHVVGLMVLVYKGRKG